MRSEGERAPERVAGLGVLGRESQRGEQVRQGALYFTFDEEEDPQRGMCVWKHGGQLDAPLRRAPSAVTFLRGPGHLLGV